MSRQIEVQIAPDFVGRLSVERLRSVVEAVLVSEERSGDVTVVITDDESLRQLNRDFLGRDTATDVLAFAAQEESGAFVTAPETGAYLGDVIVSYPRAVSQAKEFGYSTEQELELLIVHGVLHLLGYDHAHEGQKAIMWARQGKILQGLQ